MTLPSAAPEELPVLNRLIAALPPAEYGHIAPHLERVSLGIKDLLFDVNARIEHVYFMEHGVASILGVMADGSAVEAATVGPEGMVGLPVFHGTDRTNSQAYCQIAGEALRMPSDLFRREIARAPHLTRMLHLYSQGLFTMIAQSSACNRIHTMIQRCARWLLHTLDRVPGEEFSLTHLFLSQMMGVRRATVTETMSELQAEGTIQYTMGNVRVLDRDRLQARACECYGIIQAEFDRLLGPRKLGAQTRDPLMGLTTSKGGKSLATEPKPDPENDPDPA